MSRQFDVAVVGATGAVGETMLSILAERGFPAGEVYAVASARSAGSRVAFGGRSLVVQDLARFDFEGVDIGLFSPGASVSKIHAPRAAAAGCVVIDNTSEFRYDDDIPLVVPEVNPDALGGYLSRNIVANPNCSTIQMVVALKPIYDAVGIERLAVNNDVLECVALDVLHHNEKEVALFFRGCDTDNIGMIYTGEQSGFSKQLCELDALLVRDFNGNFLVNPSVFG